MAVFKPVKVFETVSGALTKIDKKSPHAVDQKMVLCTHRQAPTSNVGKCNRVYVRGIESVTRTTPVSAKELGIRTRFTEVGAMVKARMADTTKQAADQAAFKAQNVYLTMRQYLWHVCGEEWDEAQG